MADAGDEDGAGHVDGAASVGRWQPLRDRGFRLFFLGELINSAGTSMAGLALPFAVLAVDHSASALGVVVAAFTAPMVAFMLLGGALADRLPRALVLRGSNVVLGVVQATSAALVLTGSATVWQLAILQFVSGTAVAVAYPAFHGMVPILLAERDRKAGYLLLGQADSVVRIAGPSVAGVLIATAGPGWGLAADAATYAVAAVLLSLLRLTPGERPERTAGVIGDFRAGWTYARALGWVLPVASCSLVFNALISGGLGVLGPVIARGTIGSGGLGLARSGQAVGAFAVTFVLVRVAVRRPLVWCVVGFTTSALPMAVLAFGISTPALTVAFLVMGAGMGAIGLAWNLVVQAKVREDMLSRVQSIDGFFSFVAMPIGEVLVGPASHVAGHRGVLAGCVALCLVTGAAGLTRPVLRGVRLDATTAQAGLVS